MFGAVGDGVTDDSAAIQAAINTGLEVKFKGGKTYICSNVQLRSGCNINLNKATVKTTENAPIFIGPTGKNAYNRMYIHDGHLEGNSVDNTQTNQRLIQTACFYSIFENLYFNKCYIGIHLLSREDTSGGTVVENVLRGLKFNNCYYASLYAYGDGTTDGRFEGGYINAPSGSSYGIYIEQAAGWIINNLHFYGSPDTSLGTKNASHTFVTNCYIEGSYITYGMSFNSFIGDINISNTQIIATENNQTLIRCSKSSSLDTKKRIINLSGVTFECNEPDIVVNSLTGSIDVAYFDKIVYNDPYNVIKKPEITAYESIIGTVTENTNAIKVKGSNFLTPQY